MAAINVPAFNVALEHCGQTVRGLAGTLGLDFEAFAAMLQGAAPAPAGFVASIADALHVPEHTLAASVAINSDAFAAAFLAKRGAEVQAQAAHSKYPGALTYCELAARVGILEPELHAFLQGAGTPPDGFAAELEAALDLQLGALAPPA